MNNVYNEEESKRARIFQREKRQELQLIIERCNQIPFDYLIVKKVPERSENVVFGSSKPRRIYLFAEDKSVNSFMRRCFKEEFEEPAAHIKEARKLPSEEQAAVAEQKPSAIFASKVPRFQETLTMDSSQGYRRKKKVQEPVQTVKISTASFGTKSPRNLMCTRDVKLTEVPTCSYVPPNSNKKYDKIHHSFGGRITFSKSYDIVCSPKIVDPKCDDC